MPADHPTPWDDPDEQRRHRSPNRRPRKPRAPRAWRGAPLALVEGYLSAARARYAEAMGTAANTKKLLDDAIRDTLDLTTQHRAMMDRHYVDEDADEESIPAGVRARMGKIRQALDINSKVIQRIGGVADKLIALDSHATPTERDEGARRLAETYGIDLDGVEG